MDEYQDKLITYFILLGICITCVCIHLYLSCNEIINQDIDINDIEINDIEINDIEMKEAGGS